MSPIHRLTSMAPCSRRLYLLAGRQHAPYDRRIQFVFAFADVSGIVSDPHDENRQRTFLIEVVAGHRHWKHTIQFVFAIGGLVPVFLYVPGKYANLIKVIRLAVMGLGESAKILWNVFVCAFFGFVLALPSTKKATKRWPSAYWAISSGTSSSTMRANTQPARFCESRTSHQSSSAGAGAFRAGLDCGKHQSRLFFCRGPLQHRNLGAGGELI